MLTFVGKGKLQSAATAAEYNKLPDFLIWRETSNGDMFAQARRGVKMFKIYKPDEKRSECSN